MNSWTELTIAAKGLLAGCCANGLLAAALGAGVALAVAGWAAVVTGAGCGGACWAGFGMLLWKGIDAGVIEVN